MTIFSNWISSLARPYVRVAIFGQSFLGSTSCLQRSGISQMLDQARDMKLEAPTLSFNASEMAE